MKIIKINDCSECPYSDISFKNDPNQKPLWKKGNMNYYGRKKTITTYNCNHYDLDEDKKYIDNTNIPDWCPLDTFTCHCKN